MPNAGGRNPGARTLVAGVVLLAHFGVYLIFVEIERLQRVVSRDASDSILIEIDTSVPPTPPLALHSEPPALQPPPVALELPAFIEQNESPGSTDWLADGAQAAAEVGALDGASVRSFGTPARPPGKPRKKAFGWDKVHTERVEVMPGIGVRLRLSDRCDLLVSLIPMAGCSFGKIPARGDLFDGMNAPAEVGDWNDSSALTQ